MKFKKSISFVLTLCMVLSLFATFVIPASAEATNLAAGKTYTITDQFRAGGKEVNWGYDPNAPISYPDDGVKLTDGTTAPADNSLQDAAWAGFNHNTPSYKEQEYPSHKITVDLGAVCDIDSASIYLATRQVGNGAGIDYTYSFVSVKVSEDGETWTDAGYVEIGDTVVTDELVAKIDIEADVSAQYVQFRLTRGGWLFVSEVEVYGTAPVEEAPVTSNVVTDWNVASYKDSSFGASAAIIFTDAEAYLATGEGYSWWSHVSFKPTDVAGVYEVVEFKHAAGTAASFEIAEGGFVWMSHDTAGEDTPGAYVQALVQTLSVGDLVEFVGVDFANKTTAADATAGVWVDPNAPVNVALGKDYTISGCGKPFGQYTASLTDGAAQAKLTYDGNWFTFYCNGTNASVINAPDHLGYVIIDLEGLYDITSVKANCYDNKGSSGINGPEAINVYLSADGENWSDATAATIPTLESASNFTAEATVTGKARFVKFEMKIVGTFGFVNEVEVYGTEAPKSEIVLPEDVQGFGDPYAGVDVLVDGDTAAGKFECFYGNQAYLVAVMNTNAEANAWDVTIALKEKTTFNTVTVYYWDEANSCIQMPATTEVTVNGKTYPAVANTTETVVGGAGKVHAVVVDLGEEVTASSYTVTSTMVAEQANFFNMMTEIAVSLVEDDDESYKDTHTYVDGVNVGTIQQLGEAWADKPASDFWYLVDSGKETVTISVVVDDRAIVADDTQLRIWIETDKDYTKRTTLVDVKVKDGEAYVARIDGGFDAAVKSVTYEAVGKDYKLVLVLDKATLGITGEYGLNVQLGQTGSTTMHSIKYDNVTGEGATYAPWTTTEFYEIFDKAPVTSQVVENFNHADWNTGVNTFHAAYIFTDAEIYAGVGMQWWYHAAFAPVANGAYKVVGIAAPGSDAATNNTLEIPEGGFVWVAWTSSESGNGKSSGAYAKALMSTLKEGDLVVFNGLDIAKLTTTEDATATKIDTSADVDLLISHNYNFNWHCFEGEIISGAVADAPKFAGDAPFLKDSIEAADILYVVENVKGAYLVTGFVTGSAIPETAIPEGGFVYYVTANCTNYDKICHGELVGKYIILGDIDLATKFAIDTQAGNPAYAIQAVSSFKTGDADLDGKITATDYAIIRKLVLGTLTADDVNELALKAADVNGNGKVDARDYYLVKRAFLGTYVIPGWEAEDAE